MCECRSPLPEEISGTVLRGGPELPELPEIAVWAPGWSSLPHLSLQLPCQLKFKDTVFLLEL